ncbi:MAG: gamma-glutamyl-gamma-aminobutyrate hydrolase family protein [Alicyclobacillaceae bacterium]|nr:gamma-glutamyl-gamma-aminobutyrate hydrolase family protein [Alicyclobacillaceae bacterium]
MKPWIGVTAGSQTGSADLEGVWLAGDYTDAVVAAGGVPVILPLGAAVRLEPADWFARVDGLLLTGGVDLDPVFFGEEPRRGLGEVCPERDRLETALVEEALMRDMPVLAICRGMQVMNAVAGGTLIQDLATEWRGSLLHRQRAPRWYGTHGVDVTPGSKLAEILGEESIRVNSFHHQGIKEVAPGMRVAARSGDGLIEAIESARHRFAIGVQWHPENMWRKDAVQRRLFEAFVRAAAGFASGGK